jgi:hypothetical protein
VLFYLSSIFWGETLISSINRNFKTSSMILIKSTLTMFICLYVRFYLFLKLQFLLRFLDCLKKLYFVCLQFNKHNISNYYIISYEKKLEVKKHFARTTLTARAKKFSSLILLFHFEGKTRLFRFNRNCNFRNK